MITHARKIDMYPASVPVVVHLSQYDDDFTLEFTMFSSVGEFTVETGTTAKIRGTKKDGKGYSANATINTTQKKVTVAGNQQMTAIAGRNVYELVLTRNNKVLSTANFILDVEPAAMDANTVESESVIQEIGEAVNTYLDEHPEMVYQVDDTLSVTGAAADAKKTGDEIADLKSDLNNVVVSDNRVVTYYDAVPKTYADTRIALTGTVVSGYTWNKGTGAQDSNANGKYARFDNIGQYEALYVSGADIDADHRLYAFYTADGVLISAKTGSGATGGVQVKVSVPENADYVIINTLYSTGDNGRNIDPACSALKVNEQDIFDNMLTAEGAATEGYAWRPEQTPLQNSSCRYIRYDTIPDSDYIYVAGRAYRVSAPFISFYDNSDVLISSYGANSLTYYGAMEMTVPAGTSYFIVNGTSSTPIVRFPASKKTQREVNEDVNADLADIRTILDNIDPLSGEIKEALLKCFRYVYWNDDKGHDAYEELKELLMGTEYIYKLEEPLVVDGTTGYLVTDVAPFAEDRSFTMFIDYTEGGRDWSVSSVITDTIFQVKDVTLNKGVIASTYKTTNASNVLTRISIFGIKYVIRQPKENAGSRRIRYGVSYDANSGKYMALISVNETVIAPYEDQTDSEVPFVEIDAVLNIGCNNEQAEILKGAVNDLRILNHTTSQADLTAYVTGQ